MMNSIEELRNSAKEWKSLIGKDMAAPTYFGLARGTLMFSLLPKKNMRITKLVIVEQTGVDETGNEMGKEHLYDVALTEDAENLFGSILEELNEICLKVSKTEKGLQKAILPKGTYCWDDDALNWASLEDSKLKDFCV